MSETPDQSRAVPSTQNPTTQRDQPPVDPDAQATDQQVRDAPQPQESTLSGESPASEMAASERGTAAPPETEKSEEPAGSSSDPAEQGPLATDQVEPSSGTKAPPSGSGPISLQRIRDLRKSQQKAGGEIRLAPRPAAKGENPSSQPKPGQPRDKSQASETHAAKEESESGTSPIAAAAQATSQPSKPQPSSKPHVDVPSRRQPLSDDLEQELQAALGQSDLDKILVGDSLVQVGQELEEGQRVQGKVVKTDDEYIFVALGGPNEGVVPTLQFEERPEPGAQLEVIVRGLLHDEGLYELILPGNAVDVSDWSDVQEGEVVEVLVTAANTGGLECKLGSIRGFIPASQVAEYRVEDFSEFVDQKVLCVVNEANPRRGNLVLSRRAVLERERQEKRAERLAALSVGDAVDGTVRKVTNFGAFVDIGGLDGLLHISQLSWDRVNHPSEVVEEGQKVKVRIEKIDEQTGKIGLSYRALQDHPWDDIDARFPVGALVSGTVTRIAEFGAFVKLATGVEGLVHVSELSHGRVHSVANFVKPGQEVEVKVLSVDSEQQRISLSLKAAQAAPAAEESKSDESEEEQPRPDPALPKHQGPLKGGTGGSSGGERFGLKW